MYGEIGRFSKLSGHAATLGRLPHVYQLRSVIAVWKCPLGDVHKRVLAAHILGSVQVLGWWCPHTVPGRNARKATPNATRVFVWNPPTGQVHA